MPTDKIILTFGGGGVTHGCDPELEDFSLRIVPPRPNLGYIGWANEDDALRITRFYDRFADHAREVSHLPMGAPPKALNDWLADKDMVYFGGGRSDALIAALSDDATWPVLRAAYDRGCVLAGVSAGGVCWYDWILSDSGGQGYRPIVGLSLVKSGVCPHFSSEAARQPAFQQAMTERPDARGYAVDDGVCLVVVNGVPRGHFSARAGHAAYALRSDADGRISQSVVPRFQTA